MNARVFLDALGMIDEEFIVDLLPWIVELGKPNEDDCENVTSSIPE